MRNAPVRLRIQRTAHFKNAVHEAGHAVVATMLGVRAAPRLKPERVGRHRVAGTTMMYRVRTLAQDMIISAAGLEAERAVFKRGRIQEAGGDFERMRRCLTPTGVREVQRIARGLVGLHLVEIVRVAGHLAQRGALTPADVVAVCHGEAPKRRRQKRPR